MRVYFDGVNFESRTGPNSFALRLAHQLCLMGHLLADPDDYDVALAFIEPTARLRRDRPFVLRVDGFWMKPQQHMAGMNVGIARACREAAQVVWQSRFDQAMGRRWLHDREGVVIPNGVPLQERRCDSPGLQALRRDHGEVFVCSANWHPQKRLGANVEFFRRVRKERGRSCLVVLGSNPDLDLIRNRGDERIFYMGSVSHAQCMEVYSIADWMLHLAWLDHCPNTVVEALSVGTPVVCSSDGGTSELLTEPIDVDPCRCGRQRGLVVREQRPHALELVDYDAPPSLDLSRVDSSFAGNVDRWPPFAVSDLDIVTCARRYAAVLEQVAL